VDGFRLTTPWALAAALAITSLTTLCCAWRWSVVAEGLGVDIPVRPAVGAYYRSQFLNSALPGGVLGDVNRGVRHGRAVNDMGRSLRSVAWERGSGQAVQIVLTMAVLLLIARPAVPANLAVTGMVIAVIGVGLLVGILRSKRATRTDSARSRRALDPPHLPARITRGITTDLRDAVLTRRAGPRIVLASSIALLGHVAVFAVALHTSGTAVPAGQVLPLALVVLLGAAVPTSIAGWGPREGAAAWAFATIGLGAAEGVTVAVVYGVLALFATLPGAVLLLADRWGNSRSAIRGPARGGARDLAEAPAQRVGGVAHA
jgi:uncharacterized membrane protein YbhN (UPF0104 family)